MLGYSLILVTLFSEEPPLLKLQWNNYDTRVKIFVYTATKENKSWLFKNDIYPPEEVGLPMAEIINGDDQLDVFREFPWAYLDGYVGADMGNTFSDNLSSNGMWYNLKANSLRTLGYNFPVRLSYL